MNDPYITSDVDVVDIKITSTTGKEYDLLSQMLQLSIFEDIQEPTLYCELSVADALNLVKFLPIVGEEQLEISFVTPGNDDMTTYKFVVFAIENTGVTFNNKVSVYTLKAVSEEHFTNSVVNVEKAWKELVSDVVTDILNNYLETEKDIDVEPTKGILPIALPSMSPFQAIDYMRQRAVSENDTGGAFVFFENQEGFHFITIEKLLEKGLEDEKLSTYVYATNTFSDKSRETKEWKNIIRYEHLTKNNSITKLFKGMLGNNVKTWDIFTKEVEDTEFSYGEKEGTILDNAGDDLAISPNSSDFISKYSDKKAVKFFMPIDSDKGKDYFPEYHGTKNSFAVFFNENVTRILVRGDNSLKVGQVLKLKLPDTTGLTDNIDEDGMYTGNYLVTKLRHIIYYNQGNLKHDISMDCNKIGVNEV